jgi:predicted transcriptional regulator
MKISIRMEAEDALELCKLHKEVMDLVVENMGNDPIAYSTMSKLTNMFYSEVVNSIPYDKTDEVIKKSTEKYRRY